MDNNEMNYQPFVDEMKLVALNSAPWLKFLGVVNIIIGILSAITIVGILIAWLPIWLGVLLFQAGNQAKDAHLSGNPIFLIDMMKKLRTYFVVNSVVIIVSFVLALVGILVFGAMLYSIYHQYMRV